MKKYLNILTVIKERRAKTGTNFFLYNLSWFTTIFGAKAGDALVGPFLTAFIIAIHLLIFRIIWKREMIFILATMLVGTILDFPLSYYGLVEYKANRPAFIGSYPIWMTFLWGGFAMTLSSSLKWINRRYVLGAVLGALGGPGSLYAGVKLGAASFHGNPSEIILISGFLWALIIPIILILREKIIPLSLLEKAGQS